MMVCNWAWAAPEKNSKATMEMIALRKVHPFRKSTIDTRRFQGVNRHLFTRKYWGATSLSNS